VSEQSRREGVVPALPPELIEPKGPPFHRNERRWSRCVMGFHFHEGWAFTSMPQRRFVPKGLAIWGAPPGAMVEHIQVRQETPEVSGAPFPARFFASGDSYQQIAKLIDQGKEPPNWITWPEMLPGMRAVIILRNRDGQLLTPADGIELCMWGECELL
jgi:hypothetical protein